MLMTSSKFSVKTSVLTALALSLSAFGVAHAQAPAAGPAGSSLCSAENQRCQFSGAQTVAFGAQDKFVTASKTDGVDCNVANFGSDPIPGVAKSCFIVPPQPAAQPAPQPQPAQPLNRDRLQGATYVIMPPVVQGNTGLVNADQLKEIIGAMSRDSANALKRRYAAAQFTQDVNAPNVIRVTPIMVAPNALVPWATLQGQLILQDSATGQQLVSKGSYGLLTVYNHRADAANFVFDQLTQQLP